MNLLFISYWGIREGLTRATVIPHVRILSDLKGINRIYLVTVEREEFISKETLHPKIEHIPVYSGRYQVTFIDKIIDFIRIPYHLSRFVQTKRINKIIGRSALAGALAYLIWKMTKVPFYVESFEPHASYMYETGVWKKWDPRYMLQKFFEKKQIEHATGLMTVTDNFSSFLKKKYAGNLNLFTVPCAVDPDLFRFNEQKRKELRKKLGFRENQLIGIYVGKFGGLYLEIDQLRFLKEINTYFKNTGFIILSPDAERLHQQIIMLIDEAPRIIIDQVPHDAVPDYLSASDFAISLNKSFKSGKYLSPIKIGEYWANGLPVLLTEGIGDESQYIENERGGALFDISNIQLALGKLREIINDPDHRMKIPDLAKKYRSFEHVRLAYTSIIVKK